MSMQQIMIDPLMFFLWALIVGIIVTVPIHLSTLPAWQVSFELNIV